MKHILITLSFALIVCSGIHAGAKKDIPEVQTPDTVRVAALIGPSGVAMAKLFAEPPKSGSTIFSFEAAASVDMLLPKLIKGEIDIGILPPNVAAKLYNVDRSVIAAAIVGNSMLSLVTRDASITGIADLAGKTVSVAGQGATPEFTFRTLMAKAGLAPDSISMDFSIPYAELAAALASGRIAYALLPEPFATVALLNGATAEVPLRRAFSIRDLWKQAGISDDFPMTVCVVRRQFAEQHPALVRDFLQAYQGSILWTNAHPAEAGLLVEQNSLGLKAPIAAKAIPASNYVFIPALDGQDQIEALLSVFLQYAPLAVGGKLPDQDFYFK